MPRRRSGGTDGIDGTDARGLFGVPVGDDRAAPKSRAKTVRRQRKAKSVVVDDEADFDTGYTGDGYAGDVDEVPIDDSVLSKLGVDVKPVTKSPAKRAAKPKVQEQSKNQESAPTLLKSVPAAPVSNVVQHPAAAAHAAENAVAQPYEPKNTEDAVVHACDDQEVMYKFVLRQVAIEVDRLGTLLATGPTEEVSVVSSRRVLALKNLMAIHDKLTDYRRGAGVEQVTLRSVTDIVLEIVKGSVNDVMHTDQARLFMKGVRERVEAYEKAQNGD